MIKRKRDLEELAIKSCKGGLGTISRWTYLDKALDAVNLNMICVVNLSPGSSIGEHEHLYTHEAYYIIGGSGLYSEGAGDVEVGKGDLMIVEAGGKHSLRNEGPAELEVFIFSCQFK